MARGQRYWRQGRQVVATGAAQFWTCAKREGPIGAIRGCGCTNLGFHRWCDHCGEWRYPMERQPVTPKP
eukprot:8413680-Lingulodinium_polyedra.AAC.1